MEVIPLLFGLLSGIITSYTDVKTGFIFDTHVIPTLAAVEKHLGWEEDEGEEVGLPGWIGKVVIPTAEVGIIYYAYLGMRSGNALLALSGVIGLVVGFLLGMMLYYMGAWASGDTVVLAAFSALLPIAPSTAHVVPPYGRSLPLYPLAILFDSILAIFPFILVYALGVLAARGKFHELRDVFTGGMKETAEVWLWLMGIVGIKVLLSTHYSIGAVPLFILGLILFVVFYRFNLLGDATGVAAIIAMGYLAPEATALASIKVFVVLYTFKVLLATVKYLRTEVLVEEVSVDELREWDILGETIHELDGRILRDRKSGLDRLKRALYTGDLSALKPQLGRVIASPTAEGLTKEQIAELKRLVEEGRLQDGFIRKKAMPFAPALFLGFLTAYFWGDVFWWLVLKMAGMG